jgi:hypothetical protein
MLHMPASSDEMRRATRVAPDANGHFVHSDHFDFRWPTQTDACGQFERPKSVGLLKIP